LKNSISIFIPAFNEENTIIEVVNDLENFLSFYKFDYEIILLDDASQDSTLEAMRKLSQKSPHVKFYTFEKRQYLGRLLKFGYSVATKEWVMMVAADGQFRARDLSLYIKHQHEAEIITGNRRERYKCYTFPRKVVSKTFNILSRVFFKVPVQDVAWSKLVKRDVLKNIYLKRTAAIVELELLVKALKLGFRIKEIEVPFLIRKKGKSKAFNLALISVSAFSFLMLLVEMFFFSPPKSRR